MLSSCFSAFFLCNVTFLCLSFLSGKPAPRDDTMNKNKCENNFGIFEPVNVNGSTGVMYEFNGK